MPSGLRSAVAQATSNRSRFTSADGKRSLRRGELVRGVRHEIERGEPWDFEAAAARTAQAMRDGAEVIAQATFVDGRWRGRADFLLKVDRSTKLGAWGYEPLDAKLARAEKPTYVLQLCFYSDGIAAVQGLPPEHMHVLLGPGETRSCATTTSRRTTAASAPGSRRRLPRRRRPTPTASSTARSATSAACARRAGRPRTTSCWSPTCGATR